MNGARENCPSVEFEYHSRTRTAKKYCYKITMAKGKNADKNRGKYYRKLLKSARDVLDMAVLCRAALDIKGLSFDENLVASLLRSELDEYTALAAQAIEQCGRRVLADEKVPASEKIVSIFENHTDIIRRGKTMSPTEFGHKVLMATGATGLVTQYKVCEGNPGDNELFGGILEKHVDQFGAAPREFAGDRRFYSADNEELAAGDPFNVERVSIPKPGYKNAERRAFEKELWFKKLQRFRAGIEGNLSTMLRSFSLTRCLWRGWESFKSWVGLSVFAYNLRKIAALL
jgi:IS5 family transposase